ncbi:transcription termination factor Rho [Bifidobacterium italicum]|uniref:Transcription termination factor Rho n=1 Tax=Bifidobacterium italicum TaxID=1960968 RepID=A0A2A2EKR5_9BIFI|nr:transcription termination factor Rho [Bifidobacterium italicum]
MKLPELKELAKQMGLRGVSTMRKGELLATLQAARNGEAAPAGVTVRVPKPAKQERKTATPEEPAAVAPAADERAKTAARAAHAQAAPEEPASSTKIVIDEPKPESNMEMHVTARRVRKRRDEAASGQSGQQQSSFEFDDQPKRRPRRGHDDQRGAHRRMPAQPSGESINLDEILDALPGVPAHGHDDQRETRRGRGDRNDRNNNRNDRNERGNNRRGRGRDNENRHDDANAQRDDLVPVAGIVDVLDSYAFIRTSGYLPGPNDVYVSMGQVKKYGLRKGDAVKGSIRTPHEGDRRNQRQKFVPLQSIDSINGMSVEEAARRPQFSKLTPLYPNERLKMETTANRLTGRLIDIVSPIGKGQRGLIVSPPKAGKTITLQNIANAIATNNPEVYLMVVLVDERPEEVTDMERTVQGEVISSTFDRPASDHTTVAELAIERAKRLVELGQDVVVLLDSMTRLARAYNIAAPASGRILSGGVDAQALYPPKKFFGAARNIENGGSLTIISSALVETGSKMDEVIFEEFKGTGNMELRLSRELADKRMFPAVDVNASGTRREELITDPQTLPIIYRLRRLLGGLEPEQAYQTLVPRLKKTMTNRDFFAALVQQGGNTLNGN